jgi:outer membrane protein OmpA-like peptidoglycan-associated protein
MNRGYKNRPEGILVFYRKMLMAAGCALFLSGCATGIFGGGEEEIAVENNTMYSTTTPDAANLPTSEMAQYMSGGSVEVYSIDGPAFSGGDGSAGSMASMDDGGRPAINDSSVTVYPFESPAYVAPGLPPMMPPSAARRDFASPFAAGGPATVLFKHNSSSLSSEAKQTIGQVAGSASGPVKVEGHASTRSVATDPVDRHMVNLKMSMDRALNVSRELMRKGVPAESIETTAFGDTRPAPGGEAASRRVEIYNGGY